MPEECFRCVLLDFAIVCSGRKLLLGLLFVRCGFAYVSHRRLCETTVICMGKQDFGLLFMVSGMILFMFRQLRLAMKTVCSCLASCFQATSRLDIGVLHRPERVRFRGMDASI